MFPPPFVGAGSEGVARSCNSGDDLRCTDITGGPPPQPLPIGGGKLECVLGRLTSPRAQRLYLQLHGQFVELGEKRGRNRNAVAGPLVAAGGAALARQTDRVKAGKEPRAAQITDMPIDFGGESRQRQKAGDIDGDNTVSGVGRAAVVSVEINHVAAEGGAVE